MYRNYKIVCVTPAGRRRYMQYLIPQIITSDIIDRYDIWINTVNKEDIYFFKKLSEKYPVINLVWQPDGEVNGNMTINAFYKKCIEDDCIYFKLDDDIVWMEPGLIKKMVDFRIDNPDYFLVSPLVINNALCTYILEVKKLIRFRYYQPASASHHIMEKRDLCVQTARMVYTEMAAYREIPRSTLRKIRNRDDTVLHQCHIVVRKPDETIQWHHS